MKNQYASPEELRRRIKAANAARMMKPLLAARVLSEARLQKYRDFTIATAESAKSPIERVLFCTGLTMGQLAVMTGSDLDDVIDAYEHKSLEPATEDELWRAVAALLSDRIGLLLAVREELQRLTNKQASVHIVRREKLKGRIPHAPYI